MSSLTGRFNSRIHVEQHEKVQLPLFVMLRIYAVPKAVSQHALSSGLSPCC